MTIDGMEMCRRLGIEQHILQAWIAAGWIELQSSNEPSFSEMDIARAGLIRDLAGPMGVNDEGIEIILDLLDQIHGLRRALQGVASAGAAK